MTKLKRRERSMDPSALSNAEFWLSWIGTAKLVAAFLVAAGVAVEIVGDWVSRPYEKVVKNIREDELSRLSTEAESARAAIAEANARAKEAERGAAEAKLELEKFKAPRMLSFEQSAHIIGKINPFAGQEYALSVASGDEAASFLCTLDLILMTAGWKRHETFGSITVDTNCGAAALNTLSGVRVRVSADAALELTRKATIFASALNDEGIAVAIEKDPKNIPIPVIVLMVGSKPQ